MGRTPSKKALGGKYDSRKGADGFPRRLFFMAAGGGGGRKGGTPARFPPLLRFFSIRGVPRCGARHEGAPGPRPLFVKAGQKLLNASHIQPKPLAVAASDSIRPRSEHLSGRVAPPTRVGEARWVPKPHGAPPPQAPFFGAPPRFFGQDQRNGVDCCTNVKTTNSKTASSAQPNPTRGGAPPYSG